MSKTLELGRFVVEPDQEKQFLAKREAMVKAAKNSAWTSGRSSTPTKTDGSTFDGTNA